MFIVPQFTSNLIYIYICSCGNSISYYHWLTRSSTIPFCYHVIATNREEEAKKVVALHNQRGQVKNFIKELKDGFGMNWMPSGETYANAVFFRIGVIAYNLFQVLKLLALPIWWRNSTIATANWKLYQIAARVVHHAHRIIMNLATSMEKIRLFRKARYIYAQLEWG